MTEIDTPDVKIAEQASSVINPSYAPAGQLSQAGQFEQLALPIEFPANPSGRRSAGTYRSRHRLMGHILEDILDGKRGSALDIICNLTDGEAAELGEALDQLYPMVAGRRAVQYSRYIQNKVSG